jgi:hypothetical protein
MRVQRPVRIEFSESVAAAMPLLPAMSASLRSLRPPVDASCVALAHKSRTGRAAVAILYSVAYLYKQRDWFLAAVRESAPAPCVAPQRMASAI